MRAFSPLWFDLRAQDCELWAWNREHLTMLIELLEGRDVSQHPYGFLATYVPGAWKRRRAYFAARARRLLDR